MRCFLPCARGVPSHDTLCKVVAALDPDLLKSGVAKWVERLRSPVPTTDTPGPAPAGVGKAGREVIAVGGRTSHCDHTRPRGRGPLRAASAWATSQRLVLGQEAVLDKSDETAATPVLLRRLELAGALVTINAMDTQAAIVQAILNRGGDCLPALK